MDLDNDGRMDIISGSWPGGISLFRRKADGTFTAPMTLKDRRGQPLDVGSASAAFVTDWDGDGTPDLIVGTVKGVDWDGDGRLDILLGDRCGSFRAKPAQSDLEKHEERRANDRLPELRRKWAVTFRTFRELAEPQAGETTAAGQERLRLREASRREMVRYKEEIATVQSIHERYQPGYQSHGFVWIFLRQPSFSTTGQ